MRSVCSMCVRIDEQNSRIWINVLGPVLFPVCPVAFYVATLELKVHLSIYSNNDCFLGHGAHVCAS